MRRALAEQATRAPVRRALDLCCGTGAVTRALAEMAPAEAVVLELDFSWGMLSRGVAAAHQANLFSIRWVQADDGPDTAGAIEGWAHGLAAR